MRAIGSSTACTRIVIYTALGTKKSQDYKIVEKEKKK